MTVELYEMDGQTLVAALTVLPVDDLPKVALWNERAFILLSATYAADVRASYAEVVSWRLELPTRARQ